MDKNEKTPGARLYMPVEIKIPDEMIEIPNKLIWKSKEIDSLPSHAHGGSVSRDIDTTSFAMTTKVEELPPNTSTTIHRHNECFIYIIGGKGYSEIQGRKVEWEAGDLIYIPPWGWHRHWNADPKAPARFLAICPGKLGIGLFGWRIIEDRGYRTYSQIKQP